MDEPLKDQIAPILGRIPSGVFILTVGDGNGAETGMLASWVQQASFEPPRITVGVNKSRYVNDWLAANPVLAVNTVAESDKTLFKHFGKGFDPDQPAFDGIDVTRGTTGAPLLAEAIGSLEGNVVDKMDGGDHWIYLVDVTGATSCESLEDVKPFVHIRKNGFGY